MKKLKSKDGLTISSMKIDRDIKIFKYLSSFSITKFNKMNPIQLLAAIEEYRNIIVERFYDWDDEYLVRSYNYYRNLALSKSGSDDIRLSLIVLQKSLVRGIVNLKWKVNNKSNTREPMRSKISLFYNVEIDDFEAKFHMFNDVQYLDLKKRGDVCITSALSEIFSFIVMSILTVYSIQRFSFCKNCGNIYFNETEREKLFCRLQCSNTYWQREHRRKNPA